MSGTLRELPLTSIHPHPENVREQLTELGDLAQSLREVGLIQPLTVAPDGDGFVLIAGHRRFAAAQMAQLSTVPVVIRDDLTGKKLVEAMLVENLHRVDLSPIDEAKAVRRLMDEFGYQQRHVAQRIGRPESWVSVRLTLLKLPPELQGRLTAKDITLAQAVELARSLGDGRRPEDLDRDYNRPHFGNKHPLAKKAKALCDPRHRMRRRLGGMACGFCWEQVIREDERARGVPETAPGERKPAQKAPTVKRPRAKPAPALDDGVVRGHDGKPIDLNPHESRRDEQGRVICRGCNVYISETLGCGCDPGELDDDGHPLDPRYREMVVEVCAVGAS